VYLASAQPPLKIPDQRQHDARTPTPANRARQSKNTTATHIGAQETHLSLRCAVAVTLLACGGEYRRVYRPVAAPVTEG